MISVESAKNILKANLSHGNTTFVPLRDSIGSVLAENILSPIDIPSFDNSAMDGYAIKWQSENGVRELIGKSEVRAGDTRRYSIHPNEAIRIFTGAPVPQGADTILPQELVEVRNRTIWFEWQRFDRGANFRGKGAQNRQGNLIATKGSLLTPGLIGLLASVGIGQVPVFSPPKVSILLTGDELVEIGIPLAFGKIYNANGPILASYLMHSGIQVHRVEKSADDPEGLRHFIQDLLNESDILIISGGISVGDYDFVKGTLEKEGVGELFYRIKQKPGKPLWVGKKRQKWVFALPGNPASTLTCFNQYVKPCLDAWLGNKDTFKPIGRYPLSDDFTSKSDLTLFLKVKLENGQVKILPGQESFNLIAYGEASGIAEIPQGPETMKAGTPVNYYPW